jgi:hypothetical protein
VVEPLPGENPGSIPAVVSESYRYQGRDGRLSARQSRYNLGSTHYAFNVGWVYDPLGNVSSISYPECQHPLDGCAASVPARTVSNTYQKGYLRSVLGFANELSYQAVGLLHQVKHANGVTYTQSINVVDGLARPRNLSTSAGWNSGNYLYDGAGNIRQIGSQVYHYDRLNRMVDGHAQVGSSNRLQLAIYDPYGNLTLLTTDGAAQNITVSSATNRLAFPGTQYDAGGNLTHLSLGGETTEYVYDSSNMMKSLSSSEDQARIFIYNADDARILTFDCAGLGTSTCASHPAKETWTLRGLGNEVLRVWSHPFGGYWRWDTDYIYRGGQLLAAVAPDSVAASGETTSHFHPDHLGSPRQVTGPGGGQLSQHAFYPFGSCIQPVEFDPFSHRKLTHPQRLDPVACWY